MDTEQVVWIEGNNVAKTRNKSIILPPQTFSWTSPHFIAVVGPNGSGKTTLLKIISGLDTCEGDIRINNCKPEDKLIRSLIAYCPAKPVLFSDLTVLAQCKYVASLFPWDGLNDEWWHLTELLGISEDLLERRPYYLSSGEMQKASILVALARPHSIAVLDEPLSSLDEVSANNLVDWIRNHCSEHEVLTIVADHDPLIFENVDVIHRLRPRQMDRD